jgi:hypothetical protein
MMDKFDKLISEALSEEDQKLMADLAEPGFFALAFGTLKGPSGWVGQLMWAAQIALFAVAVWAGWHFFVATEPVLALKWGLSAGVLALASLHLKMSLLSQMQADRVILALRRLEVAALRR